MPAPIAYATRADVFLLALRAEAFAARARAVESVDIATGVMRLSSHGFSAGLPLVNFVVVGSAVPGRPSASLPTGAPGLSASVVYEPSAFAGSGNLFRVTPVGGALITSFTDAGTGVFGVEADVGATIDALCIDQSAKVNNKLTAHSPPILVDPETGLYPEILRGIVARRVAMRARLLLGLANPLYADSFAALERDKADDDKDLAAWFEGRGILPTPLDQTEGVPDDGARSPGGVVAPQWPPRGRYGGSWLRGAL